mgnify:CR=1 FL=1
MEKDLKKKKEHENDEEDLKNRAEQDDQEDKYGQHHKFNHQREDE